MQGLFQLPEEQDVLDVSVRQGRATQPPASLQP